MGTTWAYLGTCSGIVGGEEDIVGGDDEPLSMHVFPRKLRN
jgi:hypothetical protein